MGVKFSSWCEGVQGNDTEKVKPVNGAVGHTCADNSESVLDPLSILFYVV